MFDQVTRAITPLLQPLFPELGLPFGFLDYYAAFRLSQIVIWVGNGGFDPLPPSGGNSKWQKKREKEKAKVQTKVRAPVWQELFGLMVVVFGPETFTSLSKGIAPGWLLSPKVVLLFALPHILQTVTPLARLVPVRPSLESELIFNALDGLNRYANPTSLILVPFINAVPFAAISFGGFNFFSSEGKWTTPAELGPYGWAMVDTWIPLLIAPLYLTLMGSVPGWSQGLGWKEEEALGACLVITAVIFEMRTFWNMGGGKERVESLFASEAEKVKTE